MLIVRHMECHHLLIKNYDEACFTEDELNVGITHAISTGRYIVAERFRPQGVTIRNLRSATKGSAAGGKNEIVKVPVRVRPSRIAAKGT